MRRRLPILRLLALGLLLSVRLPGTETTGDTVFVFHNGDRVHGRQIGREGDTLLVETTHFGIQRIPVAELEGPQPDAGVESATPTADRPAVPACLERIRRPLRFWHAGINVALEAKQEDIQRSSLLVELRASHAFAADEVHGSSSYERVRENGRLTTDIAKLDAYWSHGLGPAWFTVYAPYLEWNRDYNLHDIRIRYLLAQQELGLGRRFLDTRRLKFRAGLAENFLNLWVQHYNVQAATTIESLFAETDLQLPYRIHLTDRISYYYALRNGDEGQKNEFEVTKDLTEHFKIRLRHEYRHDLPISTVSNINLWRLIFGLEY